MMMLLPVRLAYGLTKGSLVVGYRAGRLAGYRRLSVLALGVAVGLLLAPVPGRELRARLREEWDRWTGVAPAPGPGPVPAPGTPPPPVGAPAAGERSPGTSTAP